VPSLRRSPIPAAIALCVVLLVVGIWVGGRHSSWLPGPVRSALVGDEDTAVVQEAIEDVADAYYRKIPRDQLANHAIDGVVRGLDDRFSAYFDPQDYRRFKQSQNSEFSGVGVQVSQHPRGLRVEVVYDDSPAKRAGIGIGDIITRADGRSLGWWRWPCSPDTRATRSRPRTWQRRSITTASPA